MKLNVLDRSTYLKGLLVLAKKDNIVAEEEKKIIRAIAQKLDFESRFVENALSELPENEFLGEEPVKFSNRFIAVQFLKDAIKLAVSDKILHRKEISYLRAVANINGVSDEEYKQLLCDYGKIDATDEYVAGLELPYSTQTSVNPA